MYPTRTLLAVAATLALGACGEASLETQEPAPANPPVTDFSFSTGVYPIIAAENCNLTCHNAAAFTSSLDLDVTADLMYDNLIAGGSSSYGDTLDLAFPDKSLLLQYPTDGSESQQPHQKYFPLSDPRYETILGWIAAGALDD